jgi:hypothetical protein
VASGKDGLIGPFQAPYFAFRFAGGEFDRDNAQLNFITSPTLVIPWRLSGHVNKAIPENLQLPQFTTTLGVEAVNPHESALPITDSWYVRGLIGNTFSFGYTPDSPHFNSISVSSNWQVRLPSAPEIFYDPKFAPIEANGKKGDPPPMKGTQPRHFFDTTLTYGLVDWVGVSFEYSFGSLPPSFSVTDHTFKIGISLTLKQSSTGRYAILRPVPSS